jgi:hypothetical protein
MLLFFFTHEMKLSLFEATGEKQENTIIAQINLG